MAHLQRVGKYTYDASVTLGKGTFAEVFEGRRSDGTLVAIKRIQKSQLKKTSNKRLLDQEVKILREVQHHNCVRLVDYEETPDHICLIMEYCGGGDLAAYIRDHAPLSEAVISSLVSQLAHALKYLRERDIIHRDLKPQNILLTSTNPPELKLGDFGFARRLFDEDMAATFCGSPLYMAPEVLNGDTYDAMADLWSVGAIVYQCKTGKPPFSAANIIALKEILTKQQGKFSLPDDTSPELRDLLNGLLQVNPAKRMPFDRFFAHPFITGQPGTPISPADSAADFQMVDEAAALAGDHLEPVDDRSYVYIDKHNVELNHLADACLGREVVGYHSGTKFSPQQIRSFVDQVTAIQRPAGIIMLVASMRSTEAGAAAAARGDNALALLHEAMVLNNKALLIFREGLNRLRVIIEQHPGLAFMPASNEAIQHLRKKFNECIGTLEKIRSRLPPERPGTERSLVVRSAEEILYEHAATWCTEAADNERRGRIDDCHLLYHRAQQAFLIIAETVQGEERDTIKAYVDLIQRRLDAVAQLATGMAAGAAGGIGGGGHSGVVHSEPLHVSPQELRRTLHHQSSLPLTAGARAPMARATSLPLSSSPASAPGDLIVGSPRVGPSTPAIAIPTSASPLGRTGESISIPAAHCTNCGSSFTEARQRFCMHCGTPRAERISPGRHSPPSQAQLQPSPQMQQMQQLQPQRPGGSSTSLNDDYGDSTVEQPFFDDDELPFGF